MAELPARPRSSMFRSFELEDEVRRLLKEGRHELAVLVAQTLLEVRTEAELTHWVKHTQEPLLAETAVGLLGGFNLGNGRVQAFVEKVFRMKFKDHCPNDFQALRTHVERRNRVAHRGERVSA